MTNGEPTAHAIDEMSTVIVTAKRSTTVDPWLAAACI